MAKIDVGPQNNQGVNPAGTRFTQSGTPEQADNFLIDTLGQALPLIDSAIKDGVSSRARQGAESILEEFTANRELSDISTQRQQLTKDEDQFLTQQSEFDQGTESFDLTEGQIRATRSAKEELKKVQLGVLQGRLTEDEMRRKAVALFYKQVALNPAHRAEIASAIGSVLNIDPRGELARLEMQARQDITRQQQKDETFLIKELQKDGLWTRGLTNEQNIQTHAPLWDKRNAAKSRLEANQVTLQSAQLVDESEKFHMGMQVEDDLQATMGSTIQGYTNFPTETGNLDISNLTVTQLSQLSPDEIAQMTTELQQKHTQNLNNLDSLESQSGRSYDDARASMERSFELASGLLTGEKRNDAIAQQLNTLKNLNGITTQSEVNNLQLTYPQINTLAAIADVLGPGTNLAALVGRDSVITQIMFDATVDPDNITAAQKSEFNNTTQKLLKDVADRLQTPENLSDEKVTSTGQLLLKTAQQGPVLDHRSRLQLYRAVSNKDFMSSYTANNPNKAQQLRGLVLEHQRNTTAMYHKDFINPILEASPLSSQDFFLQKDQEAGWVLTPTKGASQGLVPPVSRGRTPRAGGEDQRNADIQEQTVAMTVRLNSSLGLMNTLVSSRAVALGVSEKQAANDLASTLGISTRDRETLVSTQEDRTVGFHQRELNRSGGSEQAPDERQAIVDVVNQILDEDPDATPAEIAEFLKNAK